MVNKKCNTCKLGKWCFMHGEDVEKKMNRSANSGHFIDKRKDDDFPLVHISLLFQDSKKVSMQYKIMT